MTLAVLLLVSWSVRNEPAWIVMWTIAAAQFFALKLATLSSVARVAPTWKIVGYVMLWPGMNAERFLHGVLAPADRPAGRELLAALAKLALGAVLAAWAIAHALTGTVWSVGYVGMLGLIFTLHFGMFHVASWCWRRAGIIAPPIMRAPIAATSLVELWSERWNIAFAESARRFVLRPLARHYGARTAGAGVFLLSGLVHEMVISLPARGGWGGPILYFLLQAVGIAVEKSRGGRRAGLGRGVRGWVWTLLVATAPIPLLFHAPFVSNVIVPFYRALRALLP